MHELKPFYITTTLPYVNADPHVGFALEIVQADALARYWRLMGREVFFSTGTDEHGQKIAEKADTSGQSRQAYVDHYAAQFNKLRGALNLSYDRFIRTTDEAHKAAAQEMWKRCADNGYIDKKVYKGLYCIGDEMFLRDSDLVNGRCPNHPDQDPVEIEEENYYFKLSKLEGYLTTYLSDEASIVPDWQREWALNFVRSGLDDLSISRPKTRVDWGVPVPGDENHVMYVWFDALTNYVSTLGWPDSSPEFTTFWEHGDTVQTAGKDQVRFQSIVWQAMLHAAGLPATKQVVYHGFINSSGQKMSKSLGNVLNPYDIVEKYGTDALRYYLLRHVSAFEDSDMTMEKFHTAYTADLVNGIGNLTSRLLNMAEKYEVIYDADALLGNREILIELRPLIDAFRSDHALEEIWNNYVNAVDKKITEYEPFKKITTEPDTAKAFLVEQIQTLAHASILIEPFLPETAQKVQDAIRFKKKPEESLFGRIEG